MMHTDPEIERWLKRGRDALAQGNPGGALEPLRRALTEDPEHGRAHALLACALLKLKRPAAALVEANAAILSEPESAFVHAVLGDVLYAQRDLKAAERHYAAAREFDPHAPGPLRGLASVAGFFDDHAQALAHLSAALELAPEDVDTLIALAEAHLGRRRFAEAEGYADAALAIEPEHLDALVAKGFVCLHRGAVADAREHALWALRRNATDLGAIRLFAAVKARESVVLGLWYRANVALSALGPRTTAVLLGAFVAQSLLQLVLADVGLPRAATAVRWLWLATCVYSYVGPGLFRRMLQNELKSVRLDKDF